MVRASLPGVRRLLVAVLAAALLVPLAVASARTAPRAHKSAATAHRATNPCAPAHRRSRLARAAAARACALQRARAARRRHKTTGSGTTTTTTTPPPTTTTTQSSPPPTTTQSDPPPPTTTTTQSSPPPPTTTQTDPPPTTTGTQPPPTGGPALTAQVLDAGSVNLSWPAVDGVARVQIWRGTFMVDDVAAGGAGTYTDRGLWASTTYFYSVHLLDASGVQLTHLDATATTPARSGAFPRLYADTSVLNTPIGGSPAIDPGSGNMVASAIVPYVSGSNITNDPDWGIPISYGDPSSHQYTVGCTRYWCNIAVPPFPIPASAQTSGGSDAHLVVLDNSGRELDMWDGAKAADGSWSAGVRTVISSAGTGLQCAQGQTCGRPNAAGFALAGGILRPEEIAQGHIDHALVITTPLTRAGYVACPALGTDGQSTDPGSLPEGARVQLDPALNVDATSMPAWMKVVAKALQTYGAYVVDTGGSLSIRAESNVGRGYDAWAKVGVPSFARMSSLPWDRMRVLQLTKCG
jgi:hypothetical protein